MTFHGKIGQKIFKNKPYITRSVEWSSDAGSKETASKHKGGEEEAAINL